MSIKISYNLIDRTEVLCVLIYIFMNDNEF